jgi:hypothetical protein
MHPFLIKTFTPLLKLVVWLFWHASSVAKPFIIIFPLYPLSANPFSAFPSTIQVPSKLQNAPKKLPTFPSTIKSNFTVSSKPSMPIL